MKNDSINENEAIQEGLEKFLQEELAGMAGSRTTKQPMHQEMRQPVQQPRKEIEPDLIYGGEVRHDAYEDRMSYVPYDEDDGGDYFEETERRTERQSANAPRKAGPKRSAQRDNVKRDRNNTVRKNNTRNDRVKKDNAKGGSAKGGKKGDDMSKRKKKKKSKLKGFLFFLLFLILLFGGMWYIAVGSVYNKMGYERVDELAKEPMKEDGVTNILLIGNDSRTEGEDGRSDAMILVSISNKTKKIYMTSLLRDMYVDIPGHDGNRLNAAYAYGGPTLLLETIEKNLDITVNRYVLVNFQAFASVTDAVGGVDLELTNEEVVWVNKYLNEYNLLEGRDITTDYLDESLSGMIHLNGPQALAYCRNRYIGTDFERTNRQRKVLSAIAAKLPVAIATNSSELMGGLLPQLTTNLTQNEVYSLSLSASKFLTYEMVQSSIPIEGSYKNATIRKMSVLEVDFEQNKAFIQENIYGKKTTAASAENGGE